MIMNDELERTWKERLWPVLRYFLSIYVPGTEENLKEPLDSWSLEQTEDLPNIKQWC
jgi:hypothetical protein